MIDTPAEVQQLVLVGQNLELPNQRDNLCNDGGDGRSPDAPVEDINEQGIEEGIDNHRIDGGIHRLLWMSRSTEHGI